MNKRIIIKVGSQSIVDCGIKLFKIEEIMNCLKELKEMEIDPILVTSGAIAVGMCELNITKKPQDMPLKQACAAIGQVSLMSAYSKVAKEKGLNVSQILLNHDDFSSIKRLNHLKDTLNALLQLSVVPIINENDALAVEEIKVGDNDTLSALLVPVIDASLLVLASDIDGLYNKNPKECQDASLIKEVKIIDSKILDMVGKKITNYGTGGMETKLKAGRIATLSNADMIIMNAKDIAKIPKVIFDHSLGTIFYRNPNSLKARNHFLIYYASISGRIVVDEGCAEALLSRHSLLPRGVVSVEGDFIEESVILVLNQNNEVIGKGITRYSSDEIRLIKRHSSDEIKSVLGYTKKSFIIHANDLILQKEDIYGPIM